MNRDSLGLWLGAAALAIAVLAVGGSTWWAQAAVALVVAAGLVVQLRSRRTLATSPLTLALGLAVILTGLQLVPVGRAVLGTLAPTSDALRTDGTDLVRVKPWQSLSIDPPSTLRSLTMYLTLLGAAILALRIAATDRGRYMMIASIVSVCGLCAVIVGVHAAFGTTDLYGIYSSTQGARPPVLGPLLNANHLGCLMAIGVTLSIGLFLDTTQSARVRGLWFAIGAACCVVTFATLSRGAVIAMAIGGTVALVLLVAQQLRVSRSSKERKARASFLTSTLPLGVVAVCVITTIIITSAGNVMHQIGDTSVNEISDPRSKYTAWRSATRLIDESPWVGVGRGALEPSFTRVHPASGLVTFSHLENEYLQAVVEWGIPGSILLAIAIGWLAVRCARRWRDGPLRAGAVGALVVIVVQSNVDFGLELLGIAIPATMIAATLSHVSLREVEPSRLGRSRVARAALALALLVSAIVLCLPVTNSVAEDHVALMTKPDVEHARETIARHPLDYFGYAVAAEAMIRNRDPSAVRMLNHALLLHPTHPGLHRDAARLLLRSKRTSQAQVEYAAALMSNPGSSALLNEVTSALSAEEAAATIPTLLDLDRTLRTLDSLHRSKVGLAWLERVMEAFPSNAHVAETLYSYALDHDDLKRAEAGARKRYALLPTTVTRLELSELLLRLERPSEVVALVSDAPTWAGLIEEKRRGWLLLCDAHIALHAVDDARHCLHTLDAAGLFSPQERTGIDSRLDRLSSPSAGSTLQ